LQDSALEPSVSRYGVALLFLDTLNDFPEGVNLIPIVKNLLWNDSGFPELTLPDQVQSPFLDASQIIQAVVGKIRNILNGSGHEPVKSIIKT
jgi:hypothetical protein